MPENQLYEQAPKPWEFKKNREKAFASPQVLAEKALAYFRWVDNNPFYKIEQLKKPGPPVIIGDRVIPGETLQEIAVKRPYSEESLCIFLGVNKRYFDRFKYERRPGGELESVEGNEDWLEVIAWIEHTVRQQQLENTQSGFFNPMITARILGLADKQIIEETSTIVREVITIDGEEFKL